MDEEENTAGLESTQIFQGKEHDQKKHPKASYTRLGRKLKHILTKYPCVCCKLGKYAESIQFNPTFHVFHPSVQTPGLSVPRLLVSCHCVFHSSLWSYQNQKLEKKPRHRAEEQEHGSRRREETAKGQCSLQALHESCTPKR